jgi:hypothetical protein
MKGKLFCEHRKLEDLHPILIEKITQLEKELGEELEVTRGCDCEECNSKNGGKDLSAHALENNPSGKGEAVDFLIRPDNAFKVVALMIKIGINGIGIKRKTGEHGFCHGDIAVNSSKRPRPCLWTY